MVRLHDAIDRSPLDSVRQGVLDKIAAGAHPPAVIVVGIGDGEVLVRMASRLPSTNVLAIEPAPDMARRALARTDVSSRIRDGRLVVVAGPAYAGTPEVWRLLSAIAGMPALIVDPALERERAAEAAQAKVAAARLVLGAIQNNRARRAFAGRYLLNTLTNLPAIATESDVTALFDLFPDVPAVVVAAGPSLDRTIADLRAFAERGLVIAVDTAVRPLLAAGIRPHVIVSADPSEVNARHLLDLPDVRDTWLVAEASIHPTVLPPFADRTFTFKVSDHHPWPWIAARGADRGTLQAWGSVLTTTFDLACRLGCNPIVLAGADLAYTDRLLYCRNTAYEADWHHLQTDEARAAFFELAYFPHNPTCVEPDVHGVPVTSAPRFLQFRDWLVARADAAGDRLVINATGGGILHGGRIRQADLGTLLPAIPRLDDATAIGARLASAWHTGIGRGVESRIRRGLDRVLRERQASDDPLPGWAEFGRDTVTVDEIRERAALAFRGLEHIYRGRPSRWFDDLGEFMQILEMTRQLHAAQAEREQACRARDAAIHERDAAIEARDHLQRERNEAEVAAFLGHYSTWRVNRLRVLIDLWGREQMRGATVLELACGHGDIGAFFLSLGANVTCVDAREAHLAVVRARYPGIATVLHDANHPLSPPKGSPYDFVIHMGLLQHLSPDAVEANLVNTCRLGRRIVLETEVCDSDDPAMIVETREAGFDQAVNGVNSRPSTACIERILDTSGVRWRRHDDPRLNTSFHVYDWAPLNNGRYFDADAARANPSALQQALRRFYTIEAA
jgi:2-polyprenyl-3-methyl-5-hydroxy-6-metoxy-1,4-benzoquinol methylase